MDREKIAFHIKGLLEAIGEDPEREGLKETPERVARMYCEIFRGIAYSNAEVAEKYAKCFSEDDLCAPRCGNYVVVKDITIFSHCEHHLALMYNMKLSVIYKPVDKVIGLSKIARMAEMISHRLQLQERICSDMAEVLSLATGSPNVGVKVEGEHACMTARGIRKPGAKTISTIFKGCFESDPQARAEALQLLG